MILPFARKKIPVGQEVPGSALVDGGVVVRTKMPLCEVHPIDVAFPCVVILVAQVALFGLLRQKTVLLLISAKTLSSSCIGGKVAGEHSRSHLLPLELATVRRRMCTSRMKMANVSHAGLQGPAWDAGCCWLGALRCVKACL